MYPHEQQGRDDNGSPRGRRNLDLWFYERRGARYYLRVTRLGLILFMLPIVFAIVALFLLLITNKKRQIQPDITIKAPTPMGTPLQPVIKQATPPPKPPNVDITLPRSVGNVSSTPTPHKNTNE
jgi:hypothetical protein